MPLQPGDNLPDLILPDQDRQPVALAGYRGRPLVVLFFPLAFSSTCTEEMCTVAEDLGAYRDLGAEVVGISVDSPYALNRFRQECNADFPFLSDFHREAAEAFDVLRSGPVGPGLYGVSERAAFVIDTEGTVVYSWHSTNPSELPPFEKIKAALALLA